MGSCIFNILEAPGPVTDNGTKLGALFSSLFTTLSISYVYIFMKFRQTQGGLKEVPSHKSRPSTA